MKINTLAKAQCNFKKISITPREIIIYFFLNLLREN